MFVDLFVLSLGNQRVKIHFDLQLKFKWYLGKPVKLKRPKHNTACIVLPALKQYRTISHYVSTYFSNQLPQGYTFFVGFWFVGKLYSAAQKAKKVQYWIFET